MERTVSSRTEGYLRPFATCLHFRGKRCAISDAGGALPAVNVRWSSCLRTRTQRKKSDGTLQHVCARRRRVAVVVNPMSKRASTRCMRVSSGCASPLVLSASQHRPVRERLRSGLDDAKRNLQFTVTRCGQPTGRFRFVACKSSDAASLYARLLEWNTVRHLTWCTPFLGTRVSRTVCVNDTRQKDNLPALSPAGLASSLSIFA